MAKYEIRIIGAVRSSAISKCDTYERRIYRIDERVFAIPSPLRGSLVVTRVLVVDPPKQLVERRPRRAAGGEMHVEDVIFGLSEGGNWDSRRNTTTTREMTDAEQNAPATRRHPEEIEAIELFFRTFDRWKIEGRRGWGSKRRERRLHEEIWDSTRGERAYEIKEETRVTRESQFRARYKSLWI